MATQNLPATQKDAVSGLLSQENIKKRFEQVLGKKAPGFMSSIISAVSANKLLKDANPMSIVAAAAVAASLDLPINPSLAFAHIVPYGGQAQFQMGWRGYVQLGMRSGQYRTMNACVVYEGELVSSNRFTGEMYFDESQRISDKIIGYVAYFKLLNGFEKYLYMTVDQAKAHGKKYSKSFDNKNGKWQTDFDAMALKTVLKMLLSKYGILSVEMQTAVQADQAAIKTIDGEFDYIDSTSGDIDSISDAETVTQTDEEKAAKIKSFNDSIPEDVDQEILAVFLSRTAEGNKTTVDDVKIEAMSQQEAFWKVAHAYQKQEMAKKAKESAIAPAPCPDDPETTFTKDHCDKCEKRSGCPVW